MAMSAGFARKRDCGPACGLISFAIFFRQLLLYQRADFSGGRPQSLPPDNRNRLRKTAAISSQPSVSSDSRCVVSKVALGFGHSGLLHDPLDPTAVIEVHN